jgi:hypothetical protein
VRGALFLRVLERAFRPVSLDKQPVVFPGLPFNQRHRAAMVIREPPAVEEVRQRLVRHDAADQ